MRSGYRCLYAPFMDGFMQPFDGRRFLAHRFAARISGEALLGDVCSSRHHAHHHRMEPATGIAYRNPIRATYDRFRWDHALD